MLGKNATPDYKSHARQDRSGASKQEPDAPRANLRLFNPSSRRHAEPVPRSSWPSSREGDGVFDKKTRLEFKLLLAHALEGSLSPEGERRLQELMLAHYPGYRRLQDHQWIDAGLVLAWSWGLGEDAADAAA